jgi:hypothetical protein
MSEFQKRLEAYYSSAFTDPQKKLYYERRSRQHSNNPAIEKVRIVTIPNQIKVFASMFLDQPHVAGRSYGSLFKSIGDKIFVANHQLSPYYTSAFALYRLEYFIRKTAIDSTYRKCRYHILMLFRLQQAEGKMSALAANQVEKYCDRLLDILWDDVACLKGFKQAVKIIDTLDGTKLTLDKIRTSEFTTHVLEEARKVMAS